MIFERQAKEDFNVQPVVTGEMEALIDKCARTYNGKPDWVNKDDHITTINFSKTLCSEMASLTTLALGITIEGSSRAHWLQEQVDNLYYLLRHWTEYACAYGTVILKPNGESVDLVLPADYMITSQDGERITSIVFVDRAQDGKTFFTRLEYHRFEGEMYAISNRCYASNSKDTIGKRIDIRLTPWNNLADDAYIDGLEKPLFAVLRTPEANNIDIGGAYGLPVLCDALEELKDLDISYSRLAKEIMDSKRTVLLDSDRLLPMSGRVNVYGMDAMRDEMGLPDYIKNVYGDGTSSFYQEINPTINTDARMTGLNALLSQIGFKCGFSDGYFVFDQKTGMITATQVESDDRRTIRSIKDMRDKLEDCLNSLIYALNAFADLYALAPAGAYQVTFDFGDITYNREEDKARWYSYVNSGHVPFWYFLVKFEGFSEDEAKAISQEPEKTALFDYGE